MTVDAEYLAERYFGFTSQFHDPDMYWVEVDPDRFFHTGIASSLELLRTLNTILQELGINRERYFYTGNDRVLRVYFYEQDDAILFKLGNTV